MRREPVLVQQLQNIVNDLVFGLGGEVWLRKGGLRDVRARVFSSKLGDDVVEVLLGAEALAFEHFHDRGDLPHIGDGGFFEGHTVAFGAVVAHGVAVSTSMVDCCCASLLAARKFPQSSINTFWWNWVPLAFGCTGINHLAGSHIAREIRERKLTCALFCTVNFA